MRPVCLLMIFLLFKLIGLIERTFNSKGSSYFACYDRKTFFTLEKPKNIMHGLSCQNVCDVLTFMLDNIFFNLAPSYIDM